MNMKQHSTKRRVLSILLSAMMLLSMIPAAVFQSSAAANAWDDYTNEAEGGWHFFVDEIGETTFTWTDSPYLSALLNGPGNWVNNSDWFCDWLSRDEYPGDVFYAVLGKNTMATANTWMDGSMNDGSEGNIANGNYTGLNKKLYAQFGGFMWTVTNGYLVTLNADDFDLTFQGPGTAMGNKDDAAVVINKGHMSFTDGIVVTNTGNVAVDVKSGGVIDLISDATIGAEGSKIGLRNEGTITSITGGTFYNFDNKGTVGSITGGTFDYSQAPEGVSFEQIRDAVAENAEIEEIDTGVFQVTSTEEPEPEPEPDPEDPNWDYVDAGREDGTIEITNYKGNGGAVTVPAEINGHKVVGLGNGALYQKGITSLVISEGIEYLGDDAVMFNNEMTSMTLPSTLTTVGDNCFALAYALTTVDLPAACVNFVDDPEYDCALGGSKNNGLGIFYGLGDNGNSTSEPGAATVTCYTEEAKAALEAGNAKNAELGMDTYTINYVQQGVEDPTWEYADSGRGDGTIEITGYKGAYGASVVVPSTINDQRVVGVADLVAYDQGLTSITISEGIEYIGAYAFGWLPGEGQGTSITLPSTLTTLGHGAFVAPFYLSNVTIPEACVNFPDAPEGVETSNGVALDAFFGAGYLSGGCTVTVYTETARDFFQTVSNAMVAESYPALNIVYEAPEVPVTVTFDANGGENAPAAAEVNANEAYTLPGAGEMTRENYIFAGWALSADATAEDVVTEITPTQATTVYAVWEKLPKDGGANVGTVAPGAPVVLNASKFKTIGKANWGEEDTSNLMIRDVTFEMVDGKLQVVAVVYDEDLVTVNRPDWAEWETECFELMIDPYNTYTPADYAAAYRDNLIQLRINTAGRLSGRWMAETLGGVADSELPTESAFDGKFQGSIDIDGAWLTYTFVVDLSEFGIEEGNAIGFDAHAVSCPDPKQSGWQYISYYIKADGTCSGDDGQNVWEANKWDYLTLSYVEAPATVTVTFDANGGENAPAAVDVALNEVYTLPTEIGEMAKAGYKFIGWALSADATAEDVVTEITPTQATTVYAVWEKLPKDGGANVGTVAPGAPVVLNASKFKTIGKANWGEEDTSNLMIRDVTFEMVDGKLQVVAVVYDEDLVTVNRPDWAEWETECFELMIDPYNTYTPADYAAAYRDNLIQLRINTAGRLSGRWMAETLGGVADSELPTESAFDGKFQGSIDIDGAWLTYTFVVDLSEFGIEEGNAIGFDAHAVSCPDPKQSGWQYISYYIKADGTCSGDDGQNVWEANKWDYLTLSYVEAPATVTVTFDANGGENAPAAVEVPLDEVYTLPGAGEMTRENYTFAGWALSADATAEDVVTEITPTESMTVYAVWTEVTAPCEHPEDQQRLVVDTEPGYYFHGVGHIVCDECGATIEEDVDIEPLPLTDAYNDVNPDGWYVPGVAMMTDLGIMSGKGDGIFDPDGTMLRSEMAMTMYQMLADPEEDLSDVELPFTDVSEDHWAINAIKWCYKHGIVSGATTTTFEPDSQILREQFVSMFYRYMVSEMTEEEYQEMVAGIDQTILDQFPDGAAIDDYAVEAMQVFVQAGVITGSDGMLAARGACSRGQVAQILRTILELGME